MNDIHTGFLKAAAMNASQLADRAGKRFALSGRLSAKADTLSGSSGALRYRGSSLGAWARGSTDMSRSLRMSVGDQGKTIATQGKNIASVGRTAAEARQLTHEVGVAAGVKRPHPPASNN